MNKSNYRKIIGGNVNKQRKLMNYTAKEFADLINISKSFLRLVESGTRGANTYDLYQAAKILNIVIDDLFFEDSSANELCSKEEEQEDSLNEYSKAISSIMPYMKKLDSKDILFLVIVAKKFAKHQPDN